MKISPSSRRPSGGRRLRTVQGDGRELLERLKRAGGKRGMGEQIRRRLEASFEAERAAGNPRVGELLNAICAAAEQIALFYGDCAEDAFAFDVLKGCIELLLAERRPKGEPVPHPSERAKSFFEPGDSAKDISRIIVMSGQAKRAGEEEKHR